jgi:hypothetical protein
MFHTEPIFELGAANTIMGRKWGLEFDEEQQRRLFRHSGQHSRFWKLVREELQRIGRWKRKSRGNPRKGWESAQQRRENE